MKEKFQRLHEAMQGEIKDLTKTRLPDATQTEECYKICETYWSLLKSEIRQTGGYRDETEEILFFKEVKPQFTGQLEFNMLLYRYQTYPAGDPIQLAEYRQHELQKIATFRERHAAFIKYFEQGRDDCDALYFLRRTCTKDARPPSVVYDLDAQFWTTYDWLVASIIGHNLYEQYLHHLDLHAPHPF
jgi:RteC protein